MGRRSTKAATSDGEERPNGKAAKAPVVLTEEERQALFFSHLKSYKKVLELKKAADAALKNACKLIKAEGTKLADIKTAIALETDEGDAELKIDIEAKLRIARWMGASVGTQFAFDLIDRTPSVDQAYDDGKRAGLRADDRSTVRYQPGTVQHERWHDGYGAGQKVNLDRIKQSKTEDALAFDEAAA